MRDKILGHTPTSGKEAQEHGSEKMSAYWKEAVANGLEEVGIVATPEQIERLADGFAISAENINVGAPDTGVGQAREVADLKRKHAAEIDNWENAFRTAGLVLLPLAGYHGCSMTFENGALKVHEKMR